MPRKIIRKFSEYTGKTVNGKLKIDCWSDKNDKTPDEVALNCNKKFWFKCDNCPHEFNTTLSHINNGNWCPYCTINHMNRKLCKDDNCIICFSRSFASCDNVTLKGNLKVDYWSDKNKETPRDIMKCSPRKRIFNCDNCFAIKSKLPIIKNFFLFFNLFQLLAIISEFILVDSPIIIAILFFIKSYHR